MEYHIITTISFKDDEEKSKSRIQFQRAGDSVSPVMRPILKNISELLTEIPIGE